MTPFNELDTTTWPPILTVQQISAIYHRTVLAVKKACQQHRFHPAPYKTRPYLWRRSEVLRDVDGIRVFQRAG